MISKKFLIDNIQLLLATLADNNISYFDQVNVVEAIFSLDNPREDLICYDEVYQISRKIIPSLFLLTKQDKFICQELIKEFYDMTSSALTVLNAEGIEKERARFNYIKKSVLVDNLLNILYGNNDNEHFVRNFIVDLKEYSKIFPKIHMAIAQNKEMLIKQREYDAVLLMDKYPNLNLSKTLLKSACEL